MAQKTLAVFFDGTWNRADQEDRAGQACPTNVAKLFRATGQKSASGEPQIVHYVRGVGTRRSERIRGGGFGYGISNNIREGYRFLVSNYEPGDQIYIFGFSRGAYSARSLAGLIRNVGILKREYLHLVENAYGHYKDKSPDWSPDGSRATAFRDAHAWGGESIRFLGVFDTVGALGAPYGIVLGKLIEAVFGCSFHDTRLSSIVENACHALAVDERRLPFMPTLMTPGARHDASSFEQKWFPGAHSNTGGGYADHGLSDLALAWMAEKAQQCGLTIDLQRLTDPSFQPDRSEPVKDSQTLVYRIATVLLVKLPGCIGLVPEKYKKALPHIRWNGDYVRPIPDLGNVEPFIGNPPANPDLSAYSGAVHAEILRKISESRGDYAPPNVCGD